MNIACTQPQMAGKMLPCDCFFPLLCDFVVVAVDTTMEMIPFVGSPVAELHLIKRCAWHSC